MKLFQFLIILTVFTVFTSCEFLFGTREDDTIDDIFDQGEIDPNLVQNEVGYVPILPIWKIFQTRLTYM